LAASNHPTAEEIDMSRNAMLRAASAVGALLFVIVLTSAAAAPTLNAPGTIQVTTKLAKHTHVNVGSRGPSAGDLDFYRELIYNKKITPNPIGHSDMTCTSTGTGSMNCNGTYLMPKGKLVVGGVIASRRANVLAVLGGTGLYENAHGTLSVHALGKSVNQWAVVFTLGI